MPFNTTILRWFRTAPVLTSQQLILITASYYVVVFNYPFLSRLSRIVMQMEAPNWWFFGSALILLFGIMITFLSLLVWPYVSKPILSLLLLTSAPVFFASFSYGVVFDYHMFENIVQTHQAEANSYFNTTALLWMLITGVIPVILLWRSQIRFRQWSKELLHRIGLILLAVISLVAVAQVFYQDYAITGRNNSEVKRYLVPSQYLGSGYKFIRDTFFKEKPVFQRLDEHPILAKEDHTAGHRVTILVLGETARAMNFSANGYHKPTNQFTDPYSLISFQHVESCGTATAVSVPCLFSFLDKTDFDSSTARYQDNALDIVSRAGVRVVWLENDGGCKHVCDRIETITTSAETTSPLCQQSSCYDEILLNKLDTLLSEPLEQDLLIVMHLIGSHGPTYYQRYPNEFALFQPDCARSDIQHCSSEQIINTYDNTLVYSDYVISQAILRLTRLPETTQRALLYISDHGESLGEHGYYLHGLPYDFAPEHQTHVPMLVWLPEDTNTAPPIQTDCLRDLAMADHFTHDNISHSLLKLVGVTSSQYNEAKDIFSHCSTNKIARL